eukprot:Nk52_evm15s2485 gene=Nk52_evmTU15s2485
MVDCVWKSTQEMASNSLKNMECPLILMKSIEYFHKNVNDKVMELLLQDKNEVEKSIFWENKFREMECKYQQAVVESQETEKQLEQMKQMEHERETIGNETRLQKTLQEILDMDKERWIMQEKLHKADWTAKMYHDQYGKSMREKQGTLEL